MYQIKAKVYYEVSTGDVLVITSEMQCSIESTTKEQDMELYYQLQSKLISEIDYIELAYGTLASVFNNARSYKINLETKQLEIKYYTQEETPQQLNSDASMDTHDENELKTQVEILQDTVIDLKYENLILKGI